MTAPFEPARPTRGHTASGAPHVANVPRRRETARLRASLAWGTARCELSLAGELDQWSVAALEAGHDQLLGAGLVDVVIDVTAVRRIDESGAVALAELWARLRSDGVCCSVRGLHPAFGDSPLELLLSVRGTGTPSHASG